LPELHGRTAAPPHSARRETGEEPASDSPRFQASGLRGRSSNLTIIGIKTMSSSITEIPPASAEAVVARYAERLSFETDCWDVHDAMNRRVADFVLLDVRGPQLYEKSHVPDAINLPHGKMTERRMSEWPQDTVFVVYCAGPHCNGTDKAALRLGRLGRKVKVMIGGMTGWADEGFAFASLASSAIRP
jgi:rhodanese-related sulfurtransferase